MYHVLLLHLLLTSYCDQDNLGDDDYIVNVRTSIKQSLQLTHFTYLLFS